MFLAKHEIMGASHLAYLSAVAPADFFFVLFSKGKFTRGTAQYSERIIPEMFQMIEEILAVVY